MFENFEENKDNSKEAILAKRDVLDEIDSLNEQLDSEIKESGTIIYEDPILNKLEKSTEDIMASVEQMVKEDSFISAKLQDPLNRELINEVILKKIETKKDNSSNSWRKEFIELSNENSGDEWVEEFKSGKINSVSKDIISKLNEVLDNGSSTH